MRAPTSLPTHQPITLTVPFRAGRLLSAALALVAVSMAFRLITPFG